MKEFINQIITGRNLSRADARTVLLRIISGEAEPVQTAGFLIALKTKGETVDEMVGFVQAMREKMVAIRPRQDSVDLCGTGGDRKGTFNISTTASFVAAGTGLAVAKHGNRSVSSKCGSADILEKLGAKVDLTPDAAERCLAEIGYTFLFAPNFHPAMKNVAPVRRALGIPTVFNILGPLCNPASVKRQLIGVYDSRLARLMAETLKELAHDSALVVHSKDGLDEISPVGPTDGIILRNRSIKKMNIKPAAMGIKAKNIDSLLVRDVDESIKMMQSVLRGNKSIARDAVLMNAAAALYIGGRADSLDKGMLLAAEAVDSGKALGKLSEFIKLSNL